MKLYNLFLKYPSVQTDSRKVKKGDLFFALKGPNFNGNAYAAQALRRGAAYAIIDEKEFAVSSKYVLEEDVLLALQHLARYHRLQLKIPFIGITGSNGKTTTKELLTAVLAQKYKTYATEGNLNNHIGVPLSILKIKKDAELAIIEMGANHLHEIELYCDIALPNFGLITNCGKAHLEGFGSLEGVRKGKGELYDYIRRTQGTIFRNADLAYLSDMAKGIEDQRTYGTANAQTIGRAISGTDLLKVAVLSSGLETQIQTQLVGNYNLANVLAAVAVGCYFDVDIEKIKAAIEAYRPSNSRSQMLEKGSNKIILDAYNANPSSMRAALENFNKMEGKNKWVLLGGMKELGVDSLKEHQELINLLVKMDFKNVLLCGPEFNAVKHNFSWFPNVTALNAYLHSAPLKDALVLIKGSRTATMETVLDAF
jgi:UDP-N-acetylmuramoyl-tripeptide--D-alanyl-D-alanine ligase